MSAFSLFLIIFASLLSTPHVSADTMRVLTNHIGYETRGPKRAVVQGFGGDVIGGFAVKEYVTDITVLEGTAIPIGPVDNWKRWSFWTGMPCSPISYAA